MTGDLVLCVDMGTTRIKGGAFTDDGTAVTLAAAPVPPLEDWRGFVAFDAGSYLDQVLSVLSEVADGLPDSRRACALSITSQRATVVPVSPGGDPSGPGLSWQDTSGEAVLGRLVEGFGGGRFSDATGLPPSALWSLAKILRLRSDAPEVFTATACFALLHDYVMHQLGAEGFVTDPSNASVTGLMDLGSRSWSTAILAEAGLSRSVLPIISTAGTVCGTLGRRAARATGLPEGLPLVVGGGDQQCAALGIGAFEQGDASLCLGTAAVLSCPVDTPMPGAAGRFFCTSHATEEGWVLEGIHNAFAASLNWAGRAAGVMTAGERMEMVQQSVPGAHGVRFMPFLSGIGSPDYDAAAAGTFLGLRLTHTRADLIRSVYEGVLLETRRLVSAASGESKVKRLLIGGIMSDEGTGQLLADVLGTDIEVTSATEISLLGAAALAWTGAGRFESVKEAARHLSGRSYRTVHPEDPSGYDSIYLQYEKDVRAIRSLYHGGCS